MSELKSELSGHFEQAILALFMTPSEYDAHQLRSAMKVIFICRCCLLKTFASGYIYINVTTNEILRGHDFIQFIFLFFLSRAVFSTISSAQSYKVLSHIFGIFDFYIPLESAR